MLFLFTSEKTVIVMTELVDNFLRDNQVVDSMSMASKVQEKEAERASLAKKLHRLPETPTKNALGFIVPSEEGEREKEKVAQLQESSMDIGNFDF